MSPLGGDLELNASIQLGIGSGSNDPKGPVATVVYAAFIPCMNDRFGIQIVVSCNDVDSTYAVLAMMIMNYHQIWDVYVFNTFTLSIILILCAISINY